MYVHIPRFLWVNINPSTPLTKVFTQPPCCDAGKFQTLRAWGNPQETSELSED